MKNRRNKIFLSIIIAITAILIGFIGFFNYRKNKLGDNWFKVENHIYTVHYQGENYYQINETDIPVDLLSGGWDYTRDVLIQENSLLDYFTPDIIKPHVFVLTNENNLDNNVFLRTSLGGESFRYFRKADN